MAAKKIQYSVTMRPNPIHEGDPMKAYANIQLAGHYTTEDLCEHVISHNGTYTEGTVTGVLTDMVKCIRELLLQGYSIQMGALGRLEPTIKSTGATSIDKFTEDNIQELNLIFTPGKRFENMRRDANFEQTTTRAAQAAALAAAKKGETTADWTPKPKEGGEGGEEEPEP